MDGPIDDPYGFGGKNTGKTVAFPGKRAKIGGFLSVLGGF
jgi:hypothetical protein